MRKINLFDFQRLMLESTHKAISNGHRKPLLVAPCGAGKTVLAAELIKDYTIRSSAPVKCLFLVDLTVLLDQTAEEFRSLGVPSTILQANRKVDSAKDVMIASVQTITAKIKKQDFESFLGDPHLIIFDESHISAWHNSSRKLIEHYHAKGAVIVGLTGSPWRLSKKQWMGQLFDHLITAPQPPELVRIGRIVPARCFTLDGVLDVSQLDIGSNGDYSEAQMEEQAIGRIALQNVVKEYKRLCGDRPAAAYCSGVKHAKLLAQEFNESGIIAEWQTGETPLGKDGESEHRQGLATRAAQSYRLAKGMIKVICSVGTLTAGWNVPECSAILLVRATQSKSLFIQAANRGCRVCGDKSDYVLLDFGKNVKRFGSPTGHQDYSIDEKPQRKKRDGATSDPMTKTCPNCRSEIHPAVKICPHCGFIFSGEEDYQTGLFDEIELAEWFDDQSAQQVKWLRKAKREAYLAGTRPDVLIDKFQKTYGFMPADDWHFAAVLGKNPSREKKLEFESYLRSHSTNTYWILRQLRLELGDGGIPEIYRETPEYWQVLGVRPDASMKEVVEAYQEASQLQLDLTDLNKAWEQARRVLEHESTTILRSA